MDGFDADAFHNECDYFGPTVTVAGVTDGPIIGGFTYRPWQTPDMPGTCVAWDVGAFLFRVASDECRVTVFHHRPELITGSTIRYDGDTGPGWGDGDLNLLDSRGRSSNTSVGSQYEFHGHSLTQTSAGEFEIDDIEVYLV